MELQGRIYMPLSKYATYNQSAKGQARYKRYSERHPDRVEASKYKYDSSGHRREHYHKIQDEAGCHMAVGDFYPGFRFLRALEGAEVIEI